MKPEKINSCPFCGSVKVEVSRTNPGACWITCDNCGAGAKSHPTREGAIRLWNRRKPVRLARVVYDMDKEHQERQANAAR